MERLPVPLGTPGPSRVEFRAAFDGKLQAVQATLAGARGGGGFPKMVPSGVSRRPGAIFLVLGMCFRECCAPAGSRVFFYSSPVFPPFRFAQRNTHSYFTLSLNSVFGRSQVCFQSGGAKF